MTNMATITMKLEGVTCGGCARRASAALRQIAGVHEIRIDVREARADVKVDAEVAAHELVEAIRRAGFDAHV